MKLIIDLLQQYQTEQNRQATQRLSQDVRDFKQTHDIQSGQVKSTALILEAIWELVKEQTELDDVDLMNKITEIDLRDGVKDGRSNEKTRIR